MYVLDWSKKQLIRIFSAVLISSHRKQVGGNHIVHSDVAEVQYKIPLLYCFQISWKCPRDLKKVNKGPSFTKPLDPLPQSIPYSASGLCLLLSPVWCFCGHVLLWHVCIHHLFIYHLSFITMQPQHQRKAKEKWPTTAPISICLSPDCLRCSSSTEFQLFI